MLETPTYRYNKYGTAHCVFKGSQVEHSIVPEGSLILANSAYPDERQHHGSDAAFHLG